MSITKSNAINPREWVGSHADYLYAFAVARVNDEELARDLVQETFLAALERIEKFEGRSSERTWLTAILKHKVMDVYRKRSSSLSSVRVDGVGEDRDYFESGNGHWKEEHLPRAFGIEQYDQLASKEFENILRQCMKKLPPLWFSVFTMKHIDDLGTEVICGHLKLSSSNFWVIIHRAKVNLRACLQKNW